MKVMLKSTLVTCLMLLLHMGYGQFTLQGYTTNIGGGTSTGGNFSTDITIGEVGGKPANNDVGFYLGLPSYNLRTSVVTVQTQTADAAAITDAVDGYLFRVFPNRPYDTLGVVLGNTGGNFSFRPVFRGNYLTVIDSDPAKYVASYYRDGGEAFEWEEADTIQLIQDRSVVITISEVPPVLTEVDGEGVVSGTIEEDFSETTGRIDARRRAAKRKCGLKKRRTGGRIGQDADEFELIAYGETDENGEFKYDFLPEGTYRFFVEYPGIPLDESTFVQFDVGPAGVTDDSFVLAVFVDEGGVSVELVLGITKQFFTNFSIYPNPTSNVMNISYDKILSDKIQMEIVNMEGKIFHTGELTRGENQDIQLDISSYPPGQYLITFIDEKKGEDGKLVFRLIKR